MNKSKLYDLIYDKADKLFKKYNPCKIHTNDDGEVSCLRQKTSRPKNSLCCSVCNKNINNKGCSVRCLSCKLFVCGRLIYNGGKYKEFFYELSKLRSIAEEHGIPTTTFYTSKEEVFTKKGKIRKQI